MIRNVGMQNLGIRGTAYFNDAKTGNAVGINIDKVLMMQKQEGNKTLVTLDTHGNTPATVLLAQDVYEIGNEIADKKEQELDERNRFCTEA